MLAVCVCECGGQRMRERTNEEQVQGGGETEENEVRRTRSTEKMVDESGNRNHNNM